MNKRKVLYLIGISLFIYLLFRIGIKKIGLSIAGTDLRYFLLSLLLFFPITFLQTYRWKILLAKQKMEMGFWALFKLYLMGMFYGVMTPGKLGSFIRIYFLKERINCSIGESSVSVLFDRISDFFALLFLATIGAILIVKKYATSLIVIFSFLIVLGISLYILTNRRNSGHIFKKTLLFLFSPKLREKVGSEFDSFFKNTLTTSDLIIPYSLGLLSWVLIYVQAYIVAVAMGVKVPFLHFITVTPIATLIGLIPITISGFGTRDATFISLMSIFGITAERAFALSLLAYTVNAILPALYGSSFVIKDALQKKNHKEQKSITGSRRLC